MALRAASPTSDSDFGGLPPIHATSSRPDSSIATMPSVSVVGSAPPPLARSTTAKA
jgi:hypothetical protein